MRIILAADPCERFLRCALVLGSVLYLGIAGLLLWGAYSIASAGETVTALTATVGSYHFDRSKKRCEFNPGLGVQHGREDLRFEVGGYSNSDCEPSWYAGGSKTWALEAGWRAGLAVGFFTGYDQEKKRADGKREIEDRALFVPALLLVRENRDHGAEIGYIPPPGNVVFFRVKLMLERAVR